MNELATNDQHLVLELSLGNEDAFETIYRLYAKELFRFARRNISSKEDCEEIIQDIFTSLWIRREELGQVTALRPYLFKMVRYKVIRYFQHQNVKQKYADHFRLFERAYESMEEGQHDPQRMEKAIVKHLDSLPERCQEAFKLRLQENLSNSDIAKRMNIRKSTVEHYMVTAFNHLRANRNEILEAE